MQRQGHVTDFVQQQGAAVGGIEQPFAVTVRPGKGPFAIPEQLAFEQVLRERGAVLHDEGLRTPWATVVNGPCDDFLARAGLSQQEHGVRAVHHAIDQLIGFAHHRAGADQGPGTHTAAQRFALLRAALQEAHLHQGGAAQGA